MNATCKTNFEYKINNRLDNVLEKLNFKCFFQNEGCDYIMPYTEYLNHINNCKYNNSTYGCNVMKYNYTLKDFEKCGFIGDKLNIKNHFKLCGYNKFRCLFCKHCVLIYVNLESLIIQMVINILEKRKIINQKDTGYIIILED